MKKEEKIKRNKNPKLLPIGDNQWEVVEDFIYQLNDFQIIVPKGFITDLASVPKILWGLCPPHGKHTTAAVVHDYLYSEYNEYGINRTLADKIFLRIMKEYHVSYIIRNIMYRGVRMFGEPFWKSKIKNEGYKDVALIDKTEEATQYYDGMQKILGRII